MPCPRLCYVGVVRKLGWVLRILLACLFVASGSIKFAATAETVATFERLGGPPGFRIIVGLLEIAGAVGLLLTPLTPLAAAGLAALMVGAVLCHFLVLGPSAVPATVALVLLLVVAWIERSGLRVLRVLSTGKGAMDGWLARAYDRGVQAAFREIFPALAVDVLHELGGARRLLDAGCGPGQFTIIGAERLPQAEVWGIDIAETMIELARAHAAGSPAAARLHFEVADVSSLPFPDGHFDAAFSSGSIKHWPDPVAGLRELYRVLAPGGRAFIGEMNRSAPADAIEKQRRRLRHWFFRRVYPRVFMSAFSPEEAREIFGRSPFGSPVGERMLLDGCFWVFELRKASAAAGS